jgi:2,4-dienoyl-CoA reductase-like NADH-dependent reductase (Old Yellow Enzyme family)
MSDTNYPNILSPSNLGVIPLRNKAMVAPMTRVSASSQGVPTDIMLEHYRSFAKGGWGLIFTEGTYTDEGPSQGYRNQPGIATEEHRDGWSKIVAAVHGENTPIFQQLIHAGGLIQHNNYVSSAIAPSAVDQLGEMLPHYFGDGMFAVPREITKDEIKETIKGFADAAVRSVEAGFDGIEIHGANGYLLDQFLTTFSNIRNDEYGGSMENRLRFHCEVLSAVLEAVGGNVPVGIRISQTKVNNFDYQWPGQEQDAKTIFLALKAVGPTYIHISTHKGLEDVWKSGRHLADWAKEIWGGPTIACGGLHDPVHAENLLKEGKADFIAIGKGALADPEWPKKVSADITPTAFDPGMIKPYANLQNTLDWRENNTH